MADQIFRSYQRLPALTLACWFARITIGFVFTANLLCAFSFILQPEQYTSAFELTGIQGLLVVQSFGILFLMWNATYPPVLVNPYRQMILFAVILAQQAIGLAGETWLWLSLPPGHSALWATGLRFILYDGFGLMIMSIPYILLRFLSIGPTEKIQHGT